MTFLAVTLVEEQLLLLHIKWLEGLVALPDLRDRRWLTTD